MAEISALPAELDLKLYRGDDFVLRLEIQDENEEAIDLTSHSFLAEVRNRPGGSLLETMTVVNTDLPNGVITLRMTDTETTALKDGSWDLQVTLPSGDIETWLVGDVVVTNDVSGSA